MKLIMLEAYIDSEIFHSVKIQGQRLKLQLATASKAITKLNCPQHTFITTVHHPQDIINLWSKPLLRQRCRQVCKCGELGCTCEL